MSEVGVWFNLETPEGFSPALYSDAIVNELITNSGFDFTEVEIRFRRAGDSAGIDPYQEVRWRPTVQTTWKRWLDQHPDTTLLKKSREVRGSQYSAYFEDPEKMGLFRSRRLVKTLPPKSKIHGIRIGLHALAVPDDSLDAGESAETTLGDDRLRIARSPDGGVRAHLLDAEGLVTEELPVTVAFWFAWITFYPNTTVWSGQ